MVILHHKPVTGKPRARFAVILLTSSFCSLGKSPFFWFVCNCLALLVVAFFALEIYLFLSFNHFLKVFQGHPCLSSQSCRSSGLINSTLSESHFKISAALNKDVLKTFVLHFGFGRTGELLRSSFTWICSSNCSGSRIIRLPWPSYKESTVRIGLSSRHAWSLRWFPEQCFSFLFQFF